MGASPMRFKPEQHFRMADQLSELALDQTDLKRTAQLHAIARVFRRLAVKALHGDRCRHEAAGLEQIQCGRYVCWFDRSAIASGQFGGVAALCRGPRKNAAVEAAKAPHGGGRGDNCKEEAGTALIYLTPRRSCARKSLLDGNACPHSGQERTRFAEREFFSV